MVGSEAVRSYGMLRGVALRSQLPPDGEPGYLGLRRGGSEPAVVASGWSGQQYALTSGTGRGSRCSSTSMTSMTSMNCWQICWPRGSRCCELPPTCRGVSASLRSPIRTAPLWLLPTRPAGKHAPAAMTAVRSSLAVVGLGALSGGTITSGPRSRVRCACGSLDLPGGRRRLAVWQMSPPREPG